MLTANRQKIRKTNRHAPTISVNANTIHVFLIFHEIKRTNQRIKSMVPMAIAMNAE